jgi:hypothetical protein
MHCSWATTGPDCSEPNQWRRSHPDAHRSDQNRLKCALFQPDPEERVSCPGHMTFFPRGSAIYILQELIAEPKNSATRGFSLFVIAVALTFTNAAH